MICLTGDVHHATLRTGNQTHSDRTEVDLAVRYVDLLRDAGVKVTYFASGLAFEQEWSALSALCDEPLVEFGGHTYSCFEPALLHRASKKLLGSYNGPRWYQRLDVEATVASIRRRTGRTIRAWRNHMYMHGPHTYEVLAASGITTCSDVVSASATGPHRAAFGVLEVPINVLPDHEHLFHAERTPAWVDAWRKRYRWTDSFGPESYFIHEWTDLVLDQLRRNEAAGALSTLIIHPITMYLCDRFHSFTRILDYLATRQTIHISEAASILAAPRAARVERAPRPRLS
jgi:hypothetical protein